MKKFFFLLLIYFFFFFLAANDLMQWPHVNLAVFTKRQDGGSGEPGLGDGSRCWCQWSDVGRPPCN